MAVDPPLVLTGTVTKVVDADTIDVKLASGPIRIRLHGIDAPERNQPWGNEATAFLSGKILNQIVELEPFQQDRYERMIAIVYQGDVNVNTELVRLGHAWAFRKYLKRKDTIFCEFEAEARSGRLGLWALPRGERIAPWEYRKRKSRESFTDYSTATSKQCIAELGRR
jgi:micrococcal nuclease